jgi:hypothetical protein
VTPDATGKTRQPRRCHTFHAEDQSTVDLLFHIAGKRSRASLAVGGIDPARTQTDQDVMRFSGFRGFDLGEFQQLGASVCRDNNNFQVLDSSLFSKRPTTIVSRLSVGSTFRSWPLGGKTGRPKMGLPVYLERFYLLSLSALSAFFASSVVITAFAII